MVKEPIERAMSNYLQFLNNQDPAVYGSFEANVIKPDGQVNEQSMHVSNSDYNRYVCVRPGVSLYVYVRVSAP